MYSFMSSMVTSDKWCVCVCVRARACVCVCVFITTMVNNTRMSQAAMWGFFPPAYTEYHFLGKIDSNRR